MTADEVHKGDRVVAVVVPHELERVKENHRELSDLKKEIFSSAFQKFSGNFNSLGKTDKKLSTIRKASSIEEKP